MGRTAESTIVVVAGNKLRLDVPITGDPAPTVIWTKGEKVKGTLVHQKQTESVGQYQKQSVRSEFSTPAPSSLLIYNTNKSSSQFIWLLPARSLSLEEGRRSPDCFVLLGFNRFDLLKRRQILLNQTERGGKGRRPPGP